MTKLNEVYKCNVCGNMVEVVHASMGELTCCNQPMEAQKEKMADEGLEKHVPVATITDEGIEVVVGSVEHPMQEAHYIEWIEIVTTRGVYRKYLNPGERPSASFRCRGKATQVRAYCNIHGLWKVDVVIE